MTNDTNDHAAPAQNNNAPSAVAAAVARAEILPEQIDNEALAKLPRNDIGNGQRLRARHGRDLVSVNDFGWRYWDDCRWSGHSADSHVLIRAHQTAEDMKAEAWTLPDDAVDGQTKTQREKHFAWATASGNRGRYEAMVSAASPYLAQPSEVFDTNPLAFNCRNGTLYLNECIGDATVYPANRADMITKCADVDFDRNAEAPRWRQFIGQILPDPDVAVLVQKALGYCLTGDISDQRIFIFEGKGANGKSTLLEVVARLLGDYAATTPIEMFLHKEHKSSSGPSPDVARLPGVRMVRASEPEPGSRLSESMIKQWTGGEPMIARHLHRDFFEFSPQGKLLLSVNIRPALVGKDHGIRRRIVIVPFTQTFKAGGAGVKRGNTLVDELIVEAPGILNWLLDGFRMWSEEGFELPQAVQIATERYFNEQDPIGSFVNEACEEKPGDQEFRAPAAQLFESYRRWCKASNEDEKSMTAFGRRLTDMGFRKFSSNSVVFRVGIKPKPEWLPAPKSSDDED